MRRGPLPVAFAPARLAYEDGDVGLVGGGRLGGELPDGAVDHHAVLAVVDAGGQLALPHALGAQVAQVRRHGQVVVLPHAVGALARAVLEQHDAEVAGLVAVLHLAGGHARLAARAELVIDEQTVTFSHGMTSLLSLT